jgi:2-polyprenyl-6-methoxyphenol hydroxylase-like FAD-dependent oxidoreductase
MLLSLHDVQEYDMLLGADGVNSQVRAALQAQVKDFGVRQTHVSAGYRQYGKVFYTGNDDVSTRSVLLFERICVSW